VSAQPPLEAAALVAEYEALRHSVGARRVARDAVAVTGPEAAAYLQGQCTQDIAALVPGGSADTLVLSPEGKVDVLARVTRRGEDDYVLDTDGGSGDALVARLLRFRLRTKVEVTPLAGDMVALRGPGAAALGGPDAAAGRLVLPFSWGGWEGVDLLGRADPVLPDVVVWCGEAAVAACRIEAGIPVMGRELDERTIPEEAGLVERTVSFTKGCYTGQELVARLEARGNRVARRLRAVVLAGGAGFGPGDPVVAALARADLVAGDRSVGRCTSAAWCPGVGGPAALAYVHRSVAPDEPVAVVVEGLDRPLAAVVRALPLVAG